MPRPCAALVALATLPGALDGGTAAVAPRARFSNVFSDHMVLQRGSPIELWGFDAPASAADLTVSFGSASAKVFWPVAADGSWRAVLPPLAGTPCNGTALVLKAGTVALQTLADVCIGDVYLFSGQSNIDIPEAYANQFDPAAQVAEEAFADKHSVDLRVMIVPNQVPGLHYTDAPAQELVTVPDCPLCGPPFDAAGQYKFCSCNSLRWARANSSVVRGFSATAYFTGAALRKAMAPDNVVPLGLIRSSWGGTKIRQWMGPAALNAEYCPSPSLGPGSTGTLYANMILPLVGLKFAAVTWCKCASRFFAPSSHDDHMSLFMM